MFCWPRAAVMLTLSVHWRPGLCCGLCCCAGPPLCSNGGGRGWAGEGRRESFPEKSFVILQVAARFRLGILGHHLTRQIRLPQGEASVSQYIGGGLPERKLYMRLFPAT